MAESIESIDNSIFWHPSLTVALQKNCATWPGGWLNAISKTQTLYMNNHLYVAGESFGLSGRDLDQCRLFEYSLSLDTWDIFDTHLSKFALASYKSNLLLIGGTEHEFYTVTSTEKSFGPQNKVWLLDDQYQVREADIPPMASGRIHARAVGHGKYLIVAGGLKNSTVEIYDGDAKKWSFVPNLPQCEESSQVESMIVHQGGNLYIQIGCNPYPSSVFYAPIESIIAWSSANVDDPGDTSSFWTEIKCDFVFNSSLMLSHGCLVAIGSSTKFGYEGALFVYNPSDSSCPWLNVANIPMPHQIFWHTIKAHIVCVVNDRFVILGDDKVSSGQKNKNVLRLLAFQAVNLDLQQRFTLRDLEKVKHGAKLPICDWLEPHAFDLKEKFETESQYPPMLHNIMFPKRSGPVIDNTLEDWIGSEQPKVEPTWKNLIILLKEFGEEKYAQQLELYLTSLPANVLLKSAKWETNVTVKMDTMKCNIEQLWDHLEPDATSSIHEKLHKCALLCESVKNHLTEEHDKLESEYKELVKEKESLCAQLSLDLNM